MLLQELCQHPFFVVNYYLQKEIGLTFLVLIYCEKLNEGHRPELELKIIKRICSLVFRRTTNYTQNIYSPEVL